MKIIIYSIKRLSIFLIIGLLSIVVTACDAFLDIPMPKTELSSETVFANNSTANAAMTAIYARMATSQGTAFSNITWFTGLSADEFTNYATNQNILAFHTNSLTPTNPNIASQFWTPYYNIIYQANSIIEGLDGNSAVTENVKNQIMGEALFVRAFYHFHLTNLFGDIPIITTTDYRYNATLARSIQSEVYTQIIADLTDAKALLQDHYVGSDGITSGTERVRPNLASAQALLARVYLYTGEYQKSEEESTSVINNSLYSLPNDLSVIFLKNSSETIWQVHPPNTNMTTTFADKFVLTGNPASGLNRSLTLSPSLLAQFESSDLRLTHYVGDTTVSSNNFMYVNKHKVTNNNSTEYNMIFRLAEQYLIRAEARIRLNRIAEGLTDLNALRRRADVEEHDLESITIDPILLVEQERQRELFAEGHRWFDLRRTNRIDEVMSAIAPSKGGQWSSHSKLYPIPETERNNNPNLSQNDIY